MSKRTGRKYKKQTPGRRKYKRPYPGGYNPIDGGRITGKIPNLKSGYSLPKTKRVKMKYGHHNILSDSLLGSYQWRANSCYDPDKTGSGNQPLAFDQWSEFYDSYLVHAAKYKFTCNNGGNAIILGFFPDYDGDGGNITVPHLIDKPDSCYMLIDKNDGSQSMEYYCKIQDYFGLSSPIQTTDTEYTADTSTNPTNEAVMSFMWSSLDGLLLSDVNVLVEITLYVEFFDPRELVQS